jgi:hypothetical protein
VSPPSSGYKNPRATNIVNIWLAQGATFEKTEFFIATAVKGSDLTKWTILNVKAYGIYNYQFDLNAYEIRLRNQIKLRRAMKNS